MHTIQGKASTGQGKASTGQRIASTGQHMASTRESDLRRHLAITAFGAWLICGVWLIWALIMRPAYAETTVRVSTEYQNHHIREGYKGDVDALQQEISSVSQGIRATLPSTAASQRHGYGYDDDIYVNHVHSNVWSDRDRDGFFTHFDLSFDVDTYYGTRDIYARIYLRADGQDYQFFHETDVFEIYDDFGSDEYTVEAKLVANYAAAHYDVRIEIFEHGDDIRWDMVDGSTHRNLFALPLESDIQDEGPADAIVHEHAGSTGLLGLSILGILLVRRRSV